MLRLAVKRRIKQIPAAQPLVEWVRDQRRLARIRRALKRPLPESISIELTNECNLRCAKCPTYEAVRPRGMMAPGLYEKILGDIRRAGSPTEISLSGGGEALLHAQFPEFVAMARAVPNVTRVGFATNGLGLEPDLSRRLLEAGLTRLKVSLDTVDAKTYQTYNRVDGYERVVHNVKTFCRMNREGRQDCDVTLKVTLYKDNEALLQRLQAIWLDHVDQIKVTGLHNWAGLRGARSGGRADPCELVWTMMQILWNGQITLCCFDSMEGFYNMGNAQEADLAEYWQRNAKLQEIRRDHLRRDFSRLPVCNACNQDRYMTRYFFQGRRSGHRETVDY